MKNGGKIVTLHVCISTEDFVEVDLGVRICSDATVETVLEVFKDCRGCRFAVGGEQGVPE